MSEIGPVESFYNEHMAPLVERLERLSEEGGAPFLIFVQLDEVEGQAARNELGDGHEYEYSVAAEAGAAPLFAFVAGQIRRLVEHIPEEDNG
jgi:hypothetical protein